jgi:hypothetical protein
MHKIHNHQVHLKNYKNQNKLAHIFFRITHRHHLVNQEHLNNKIIFFYKILPKKKQRLNTYQENQVDRVDLAHLGIYNNQLLNEIILSNRKVFTLVDQVGHILKKELIFIRINNRK